MKYKVEFNYGQNGTVVIDVPRIHMANYDEFEDGDLDYKVLVKVVPEALKFGLDVLYSEDDVLALFLKDYDYEGCVELSDEQWDQFNDYIDSWELIWVPELNGFVQSNNIITPMPPNTRVGVIEWGSKPKFNRLGVGRR